MVHFDPSMFKAPLNTHKVGECTYSMHTGYKQRINNKNQTHTLLFHSIEMRQQRKEGKEEEKRKVKAGESQMSLLRVQKDRG